MRPLSAKWNKHRSQYERSSECLHVWHRSVVLRGVRDRFQADCRQCSRWDEQARLLQHGRFACARVPTARLCNSVRGCRRTAIVSAAAGSRPPTVSTYGRGPHQFRTRNDLAKTQRTRSNSNENAAKSTKLIIIPSLITVWLQVRVLPGPPRFALRATRGVRRSLSAAKAKTDWSLRRLFPRKGLRVAQPRTRKGRRGSRSQLKYRKQPHAK
jgi:hypothetical protein